MNAPFTARILRSYQSRAATWLYERDAAFLIAPLGAGKGAASLTALAELIRDEHRRHALVIAPKLVATTVWPLEVASWPHLARLKITVLDGSPERRDRIQAGISSCRPPSSPTARCGAAPSCPGRSGTSDRAIRLGASGWRCPGRK